MGREWDYPRSHDFVALLPKLACGTVGIEGKLRLEKQCGGAFVRWTLIFRSPCLDFRARPPPALWLVIRAALNPPQTDGAGRSVREAGGGRPVRINRDSRSASRRR